MSRFFAVISLPVRIGQVRLLLLCIVSGPGISQIYALTALSNIPGGHYWLLIACRMVVAAIYEGRVIYTPTSFIDILPDHYKQKPIALYNPRQAPILNQYRLIVPRTRNVLEVAQFIVLLFLFLFIMVNRNPSTFGGVELAFIIYTLGWVLDQFVSTIDIMSIFISSEHSYHRQYCRYDCEHCQFQPWITN